MRRKKVELALPPKRTKFTPEQVTMLITAQVEGRLKENRRGFPGTRRAKAGDSGTSRSTQSRSIGIHFYGNLEHMKLLHSTALLRDLTSTGKAKFWQGHAAEGDDGSVYTFSEFWQEGSKKQMSAPTTIEGKNIGKKNETTPQDQAIAEITSDFNKKQKKGYKVFDPNTTAIVNKLVTKERVLPMLAHNFTKRAHDISWPCHAQPKLDGVRAVTDGEVFWSREGNLFSGPSTAHLTLDFTKVSAIAERTTDGRLLIDGELMLDPEEFTFEQTISCVKDMSPDAAKQALAKNLKYHVFDIVDPKLKWVERLALLRSLFARGIPDNWVLVPTVELADKAAADRYMEQCAEAGHEGIMLRNKHGLYKVKHRSKDLQKYKPFIDDEFEIIGYKEGEAKFIRTPIWLCITKDGKEFEACPMGTMEHKRQLWLDRDKLVGQKVTITYQNLTAEGKPRFPIAKAIRSYE